MATPNHQPLVLLNLSTLSRTDITTRIAGSHAMSKVWCFGLLFSSRVLKSQAWPNKRDLPSIGIYCRHTISISLLLFVNLPRPH